MIIQTVLPLMLLAFLTSGSGFCQIVTPDDARKVGMESLRIAVQKDGGVPLPHDLDQYVCNRAAAIELGKALFWDMQVGSDGIQACGTCHFHGGADSRNRNQLNPALLRIKNTRQDDVAGYFLSAPDADTHFEMSGPNHTMQARDFTFIRSPNKLIQLPDGTVEPDVAEGNRNDISSSQGVFLTRFEGINPGQARDRGTPLRDPVFNVHGVTVRREEPRNTPSVINAVFNFAQFWDGRANNHFNGATPFGPQDENARIFESKSGKLCAVKLDLEDAGLASQAVGPPVSFFEMSYGNGVDNFRTWPQIGKKMLDQRIIPLGQQRVHPCDSVLRRLSNFPGRGLKNTNYLTMVKRAFHKKFWDSNQLVYFGHPWMAPMPGNHGTVCNGAASIIDSAQARRYPADCVFTQMEANFSMFFGIAVMLYESTLVADQTPFDRWMETGKFNGGFGAHELAGLNFFGSPQRCLACHGGPELSNASIRNLQNGKSAINPMQMSQGDALYDTGFYNIAVTPTVDDPGRGGSDPFGRPLSFARQFCFVNLGYMQIPFPITGSPLPLQVTLADGTVMQVGNDLNGNGVLDVTDELLIQRAAVDGAFKTPQVRNAVFTGPYFHHGGVATLMQLVEAYNHGQNFRNFNLPDFDRGIRNLGMTEQQKSDLVAFLVSLTDSRVRNQAAPFDHPELLVPNGHFGTEDYVPATANGQAADKLLLVPAVGAAGDPCNPLQSYLGLAPQDDNPDVNPDAFTNAEWAIIYASAPGVLANDASALGKPLRAQLSRNPAHGKLALFPDGAFIYCPAPNFTGQDKFAYTAVTDTFDSRPTTVTLTVVRH